MEPPVVEWPEAVGLDMKLVIGLVPKGATHCAEMAYHCVAVLPLDAETMPLADLADRIWYPAMAQLFLYLREEREARERQELGAK